MKNFLFLSMLLLFLCACGHGQEHGAHNHHGPLDTTVDEKLQDNEKSGEATTFPTVGYRKVYERSIPFPVEKVFPLIEPQGRSLLYEKWKPTVLREGKGETLKGHVEFSTDGELDVFLTVTEHNPADKHIQYLIVWGDFEIQRIDIYCSPGQNQNTTRLTWVEYNAGLYKKGVTLVGKFVEEGYLIKVVERYLSNIIEHLTNEK